MQYYCFRVAWRTVTNNVNAFMATKLITRANRQCLGVIRQTFPPCFMLLLLKMLLLLLLFLLLLMMLTMLLLMDQPILFMDDHASLLLLLRLLFYALTQMLFTIACIISMLFLLVPFHLYLNVFTVHKDKYPKDTCTQE